MKLLLTSQGITNKSIEKKFFEMVGKPAEEIRLAFVPTAMNLASTIDKRYAIKDLMNFDKLNIGVIDIVDFSAMPQELWQPRLSKADVIYVEGGNTPHLLRSMKNSGFSDLLPDLLKSVVYVGRSAGSIVVGKRLTTASTSKFNLHSGLGVVDFSIRPHFNNSKFSAPVESLAEVIKDSSNPVYVIDDDTAIAVEDGKIEVISEGKWKKFEK